MYEVVPDSEYEEIYDLLVETGQRMESMRREAETHREYRDALLLVGKEAGMTIAEMARAVGMRREQAHYAIQRARALRLERQLEEVENGSIH